MAQQKSLRLGMLEIRQPYQQFYQGSFQNTRCALEWEFLENCGWVDTDQLWLALLPPTATLGQALGRRLLARTKFSVYVTRRVSGPRDKLLFKIRLDDFFVF